MLVGESRERPERRLQLGAAGFVGLDLCQEAGECGTGGDDEGSISETNTHARLVIKHIRPYHIVIMLLGRQQPITSQ